LARWFTLEYQVKNKSLAEDGFLTIEWAESRMPVLEEIKRDFKKNRPLDGVRIGACLHVTKETAVLIRTLVAGGADVALCGSNPLSTQDNVAAALAEEGVNVFAWREQTNDEYYQCIENVLSYKPKLTMDDGADLVSKLHSDHTKLLKNVVGGTEETTTGVIRLRAMAQHKALKYPIIAVNDAYTKHLFDNRYGTGQSTIDGILRSTSILLAGKKFVVVGYGWCGRGIAMRARGMGAHVTVTEVDPLRALEAVMDGYTVEPIALAVKTGDIFVTATGDINAIDRENIAKMKDKAIIANSGHFNVEINIPALEEMSVSKRVIRPNVKEYTLKDGRHVYLLADGRLVNLSAAEGHPPEVMMMSFANQALCTKHLVENEETLKPDVYPVPQDIDRRVAVLALKAEGISIDELSEEQKKYLESWELGTV
jgi:adenosylhomocysteinase